MLARDGERSGLELCQDRFDRRLRNGVRRNHLAEQSHYLRISEQGAATGAGQSMCLGKGPEHRQVRYLLQVARQAAACGELARKFDIGLVDDHDRSAGQLRRNAQDGLLVQEIAGGIVRRAQEQQLHLGRAALQHRRLIQRKVWEQRYGDDFRALNARCHGVHAESRGAHHHRVASRAAERTNQQINSLVATAADEELVRPDAIQLGQSADQLVRLRLRVPVQTRFRLIAERSPRKLVRVQALQTRLPGGVFVGLERHDLGPSQFFHPTHQGDPVSRTARRRVTACAWASRPSSCARVTATGPSERKPAGVSSWTVTPLRKSSTDSPLYARA